MAQYELRLAEGKTVEWEGKDGVDAALRYVDAHRDAKVIAYRRADRHGLSVGAPGPNSD